jgi:pyruvate dehydrogenase E2 component (dihydrolipoamide acetyltransferase)
MEEQRAQAMAAGDRRRRWRQDFPAACAAVAGGRHQLVGLEDQPARASSRATSNGEAEQGLRAWRAWRQAQRAASARHLTKRSARYTRRAPTFRAASRCAGSSRSISLMKQTIPHFYLTVTCTIDACCAREEINAAAPKDKDGKPAYKLSVNDFVIKALALALQRIPNANVSWTEAGMLKHKHSDIGVAVAMPAG